MALFKPLAPGSAGKDLDVDLFQRLLGDGSVAVSSEELEQGTGQDKVTQAVRRLTQGHDVVIVEGLSGLDNQVSGRLAHVLDAKVVVVIGFSPGLKAEHLIPAKEVFGERLLGLVINGATRHTGTQIHQSLLPSLTSQGLHVWGVVPEDRRLLSVTVRQLADHLHGRFIGEPDKEKQDKLVEHLLIGGRILDWGVLYFGQRDNKAVIVRGNRPDIQMSALETPTSCLVLTNGTGPIEYVHYEAEEEEVPVIVVETDTLSTAAALETIIDRAGFDHHLKLERFQELLDRSVDIQGLYSSLVS